MKRRTIPEPSQRPPPYAAACVDVARFGFHTEFGGVSTFRPRTSYCRRVGLTSTRSASIVTPTSALCGYVCFTSRSPDTRWRWTSLCTFVDVAAGDSRSTRTCQVPDAPTESGRSTRHEAS